MATKKAYLTINDSPSPHIKQKVDFLLSKGIPAIFFCEGRKIEEHSNTVIYAIKNDFIIGNHSYFLPYRRAFTRNRAAIFAAGRDNKMMD